MNEAVINKRLTRIENRQSSHETKVALELSEIRSEIKTHGEAQRELLDSISWLKKEATRAVITVITTVVGTGIVTIAALIWGLVVN